MPGMSKDSIDPVWNLRAVIVVVVVRVYTALFSALAQTYCAHVARDSEWVCSFVARIFNIHRSGVLTALFGCCMAGATWNCCRPFSHLLFRPEVTLCGWQDVETQWLTPSDVALRPQRAATSTFIQTLNSELSPICCLVLVFSPVVLSVMSFIYFLHTVISLIFAVV